MLQFQLLALLAGAQVLSVLGDTVGDLERKGRPQVDAMVAKSKTCSKENLRIRKEWGDLSKDDRRAYIKSVQCLLEKPPRLTGISGVTNRYEDFVAVHMNQTLFIHATGSFVSWHRYYVWSYEEALRNECGYKGAQPYWGWDKWYADPEASPIFDGSDTSMSGNGEWIPGHNGTRHAPPGNGGGCVTTGPFKNMTVNLGPAEAAVYPLPPANPRADGLGKNPRCLRRDMSNKMTSRYHRPELITSLITDSPDIATFQSVLQHPATSATPGVHGTGHFTIGGDPGADLYASPGDPAFWLHHAMVDRVWAIWQAQDMEARTKVVAGVTIMRNESSPAATLDDKIDLGVLEDKVYKARDLLSTVDGPFCYTYE